MRRHSTGYDILFFAAIAATLISLAPALAHLFELPRKMTLSRDAYFTVQQIYSGWALFGVSIFVQLITIALLAFLSLGESCVFRPVVAALLLLVAAQVLFWHFTFPANTATRNWTVMPADCRRCAGNGIFPSGRCGLPGCWLLLSDLGSLCSYTGSGPLTAADRWARLPQKKGNAMPEF